MPRGDDLIDQDILVQSRALGDPTRNAVFAYVRGAPGPVGVAELTDHFGLNHNAIRQHLAKLRQAGLVVEEQDAPSGPGRPRLRYRPMPGAAERWGGPSPFEALSMMLLELLRGEGTPREVGRRAGRRLAADHGRGADAVEVLDAVARRLGFEPRVAPARAGVEVVLDRCPFVGPAASSPEIVCDLHRGIAEGIAEQTGGEATITDLVVRPPRRAGCRIKVATPA
ncbi:MAG: helix-turn-helix transcriptional regulator [Acidimicrobiia bacterium]